MLAAALAAAPAAQPAPGPLIESITQESFWANLDGRGVTWFHPRVCRPPGSDALLMTVQTISGPDVYGPVHESVSRDMGRTWSKPEPIPGFGRRAHADGIQEGFCDTAPEAHAQTGSVLAVAQNVYYRNERLTRPNDGRYPVYMVRRADGRWGALKKLEWEHPEASALYMSNCAQRATLENGDVLVPMSFGPLGRQDRAVATTLCSIDGEELRVKRHGNFLRLSAGRGLLEPSVVRWGGRFLMTIRAENQQGFVAASGDGLEWNGLRPWCWEDGEPLRMSTTQQRWLAHSEGLFLVYTRRDASNVNVMRWRAPLFVAQVDGKKLCLMRETERVAVPLYGDGVKRGNEVEHLGNFHATMISAGESLITSGTVIPANYRGAVRFGRVRWGRANGLAPGGVRGKGRQSSSSML